MGAPSYPLALASLASLSQEPTLQRASHLHPYVHASVHACICTRMHLYTHAYALSQEPTLQEVVVVYAELSDGLSDGGAASTASSTLKQLAPDAPVLRLKSFRDIPLADVEVVLPGLKVERMKSADVVKCAPLPLSRTATFGGLGT